MKHVFFIIMYLFFFLFGMNYHAQNRIVISKQKLQLYVINSIGDTLCSLPCAVGENYGNKKKKGDRKTPEGKFSISKIQNSKKWTHNFKDGAGERKGAYGPWFIRLRTPRFAGIGIHCTCFPNSIGSRSSEGCIRLLNEDIQKLVKLIKKGNVVIIEKDSI